MAKKKWMQGLHLRKGAFTAKAKRAHMSTAKFTTKVLGKKSKASPRTKRQANLARTFSRARRHK